MIMNPAEGAPADTEFEDSAELGARAAHGAAWLGVINLASKGSQIMVTLILASFLTQGQLGLVTVAVSLITVAQVIQAMGVYDVIARTDGNPLTMTRTVATLSIGVGAVAAVILVAGASPLADLLGAADAAPLIMITAISLPFTALGGVQMALMHRDLDFRRRMLPDAGSALIGAVFTVALAVTGAGAYSLAVGLLVGAILQPVFGFFVGVRILPSWDREAAAEAMRWIRVVGPAAIVWTILINIDYPTISRVLGPDAVGVYSLAYRIAWIPYIMVAVVLGAVAFPVYTSMIRRGERDQIPAAVGRLTHATLLIAGGMYALIAIMAPSIVVLGGQWSGSVPVLIVLCGYGLGISVMSAWYEGIRVVGWTRTFLALESTHLILLATLLPVLTRYGVVAAALAQVAAVAVLIPVAWIVSWKAKVAPPVGGFVRAILGLLVPAGACYGMQILAYRIGWMTRPVTWTEAIVEGVVMVVIFVAVAYMANKRAVDELWRLRGRRS